MTVRAEFDSSYELTVSADDVLDEELSHAVDVDADFLSAFIGYAPAGGGTTYTLVSADYTPIASCFGSEFEGPCFDQNGESNFVSDSSDVSSLGAFEASDFVGIGLVTTLSAIIAIPGDALFFLDNVGSAQAELSAYLFYSDLTVEYEYLPIPEPSALALAALGLLGFGSRWRQRA